MVFLTIHYNIVSFLQMAVIPRTAQGHGWLRPAVGVVELSQCIVQVLNYSHHLSSSFSLVCELSVLYVSFLHKIYFFLKV